jgi:pyruvate kinase
VDLFVVLTKTGRVARALAKQRPIQTILACSTYQQVVRQLNTCRGVIGYKVPEHPKNHEDRLLQLMLKVAREQGLCLAGNKILLFTAEHEGLPQESVSFKMIEVVEE